MRGADYLGSQAEEALERTLSSLAPQVEKERRHSL